MAALFLGRTGVFKVMRTLRTKFANRVTILAYHRILDIPDESAFPFDVELVSASVAAFASQMRFVKENYKPTSFEELGRYLDGGEQPPSGSLIITFDDGFSDNYFNAFPILKQLNIPATIFLATGYIDSQEMYWYEKLCFAVMATQVQTLSVPGFDKIDIDGTQDFRRNVVKGLMHRLKRVPNDTRLKVLDHVYSQLLTDRGRIVDSRSEPMTWEQVKEMSEHNIEFGSHSVSHPVLSMLDDSQLQHELVHSKHRIEAILNKNVQAMAYPVGGADAFNENVRAATKSAGYRFGLSYLSGVDTPGKWDAYALRRLHVERYVDLDYFEAMLSAPEFFAY